MRLAAGCNVGVDLAQIPVSTSLPPENVVRCARVASIRRKRVFIFRFALGSCENRLDLGWTLYPNDTIVFQLTRNGSFTAQCVSDKATLAPCTIYAQPSIGEFFKLKPTGIYPDCVAPNNAVIPAAPMSVTTAPSLDVLITGGIATGVGYCSGSSYLYYMPPQEIQTTTIPNSVGAPCEILRYNYTVQSNGSITHYLRSRENASTWYVNCSTTPSNASCSGTYSPSPSIVYIYSVSVMRYGAITQSINTGVCGVSQAPTFAPTVPTLAPTLTPTPPTFSPTLTPTLAPTPPTLAPTPPTLPPTLSLDPTVTPSTVSSGSLTIPGVFFCVFLFLL